jgi:predicted acyl esterase
MVQLQSTWFPLIDRNPQTYVPSLFDAKLDDFRPATPASTARRSTRRT